MDFSPRSSRRPRKPPPPKNSDLYSTFVVHDDVSPREHQPGPTSSSDIYATMVYKGDEEDDEESLPPLLKRLPMDFGRGGDDVDDGASISGTMIVKTDRSRSNHSGRDANLPSPYSKPRSTPATPGWDRKSPRGKIGKEDDDDEENGGDFGTFVVRGKDVEEEEDDEEEEEGMGTMVRRGGGGGGGGGTMRRAVESMQKAGDVGGMGRRKKSIDGMRQLRQQGSRIIIIF